MSAMVFAAGGLLVLGVAFLIVPLLRPPAPRGTSRAAQIAVLYREQLDDLERDRRSGLLGPQQHARAVAELQRRMLRDAEFHHAAASERRTGGVPRVARWALPASLALALPIAAVALYSRLGSPDALDPVAVPAQLSAQEVEAMVEGLAQKLQERPDDLRGWTMLGRSYLMLGRYALSAQAFEQALAMDPGDVDLLINLAAALRAADPQGSSARVAELAAKALAIDADSRSALAFSGLTAFERGEYRTAISHWKRLQRLLPPESELAAAVGERLNEAHSILSSARE